MENTEETRIIEENLKRIFDAVNWIKTADNSKLYDACESHDSVRMAVCELPKINSLLRKMPTKSLKQLMDHEWRGYDFSNCMCFSMMKTQIYFIVAEEMNVDLGFSFSDLERFVLQVLLFFNNYTVPRNGRGDVVPCSYRDLKSPFFTLGDIAGRDTKLESDKVERMLGVFSVDINSAKEMDVDGLLRLGDKYCMFYPDFFVMAIARMLDKELLRLLPEGRKDEYYRKRGDAFEGYLASNLIDYFGRDKICLNYEYRDGKQKNELDAVLELDNAIIVFEAKSSKYDEPYDFSDDDSEELFKGLRGSFGRGFLTLDRAYKYFSENEEVKLYKGKESKTIVTNGKAIYNVLYTLNDIRSIGGRISKICKQVKIAHFPACLSCCDFQTIMANAGTTERLCTYLERKSHLINDHKSLTFDLDEVDSYGMIMSDQYEELEARLSIMKGIDCSYMVGNSCYRESANHDLNGRYMSYLMHTYTSIMDGFEANGK